MEGALVPTPGLALTGNLPENFRRFKQKFELYLLASGGSSKSADVQKAILLHVIGDDAQEIYNTLTITPRTNDDGAAIPEDTSDILNSFEEYCNPRRNVVYERDMFIKKWVCVTFSFLGKIHKLAQKLLNA